MGLWEVSLKASYDYPFIAISREIPDTPISMWCLWNRELLQVASRDPAVLRYVERSLRKAGHIIDEWVDGATSRIFLLDCTCPRYDSLWNVIEAHECWDAPPVVYHQGWANFRVLTFDAGHTRDLYQDLLTRGPAELVRKRELPLSVLPTSIYTHALFGGLTGRQADALLAAHRHGYYTSPRPTTTEEIAATVGLSRSTYEEHLRKAENRVMAALVPYLQLFQSSSEGRERAPERAPGTGPFQPSGPTPPPSVAGRGRRGSAEPRGS